MKAEELLDRLEKNGFDFFTGVPCSYLKSFCRLLEKKERTVHTPAPREDIAVGLAAGAYMAGKLPVVYMQNSGLGYSLEAFASLHLIYGIPTLVLLSYRGPADAGWEEHLVMGEHTEDLLRTFHMPYTLLDSGFSSDRIPEIKKEILEKQTPYFLLVGKEALS